MSRELLPNSADLSWGHQPPQFLQSRRCRCQVCIESPAIDGAIRLASYLGRAEPGVAGICQTSRSTLSGANRMCHARWIASLGNRCKQYRTTCCFPLFGRDAPFRGIGSPQVFRKVDELRQNPFVVMQSKLPVMTSLARL